MNKKNAEIRPKQGSPHRISPELYFGQVWLEKDLFNMVRLFAHWNHVSNKKAAHLLITYGLQYYATAILRAEEARQSGLQPPEIRQLPFDTIAAIVEKIKKEQKKTHASPQSESNPR
jgi:hypothetical protein